jgi:hypothetical protein
MWMIPLVIVGKADKLKKFKTGIKKRFGYRNVNVSEEM